MIFDEKGNKSPNVKGILSVPGIAGYEYLLE